MFDTIDTPEMTKTKSPLKVWFLTKFRGQRVFAIRATPALTLLGVIVYSRCWVLIAS
jgi:hypothetical protein